MKVTEFTQLSIPESGGDRRQQMLELGTSMAFWEFRRAGIILGMRCWELWSIQSRDKELW